MNKRIQVAFKHDQRSCTDVTPGKKLFDEFEKYKAEDEGGANRRAKNTLELYLYDHRNLSATRNSSSRLQSTILCLVRRISRALKGGVREEAEEFEAIANPITQKLYRIAKADKPTLKAGWGT